MTRSALFLFTALSLALHLLFFLALPAKEDSMAQAPVPLRVGLIRELVEDTATATKKSVSSAASTPSSAKSAPTEPPQPPLKQFSPPQEKTPPRKMEPPPPDPAEKKPAPQDSVLREEPALPPEPVADNIPPAPEQRVKSVQELDFPSDAEPQRDPNQAESVPKGDENSPPSQPSEAVSAGAELVQAAPDYALNPPPHYPQAARSRGWEGTVTVRVHVSASGRAESVTLEESSGYSLLDRSALKAVRRWRFHPALLGENAVKSEVLVPVIFRMRDS